MTSLREIALSAAIAMRGEATTPGDVILAASSYLQFLEGGPQDPVPAAAPPRRGRPPKTGATASGEDAVAQRTLDAHAAREATQIEAEDKEADKKLAQDIQRADAPTIEAVGGAIAGMLAADKRGEAIALLKKFGASSKSSLKVSDYPAFLAQAEQILLQA